VGVLDNLTQITHVEPLAGGRAFHEMIDLSLGRRRHRYCEEVLADGWSLTPGRRGIDNGLGRAAGKSLMSAADATPTDLQKLPGGPAKDAILLTRDLLSL
jgi:hypothetical protein